MISIADLNDLRGNPQVAYPHAEYDEIRAEARRKSMRPVDPREIPRMQEILRVRGTDWCRRVLGWPTDGSLRGMSGTDADMLVLAHARAMDPPEPPWLAQWKAESAATRTAQAEARESLLRRDRERWAAALATCGVEVQVRPNVHGRRYRTGMNDGPLRHVVPLEDARSTRPRLHQAGRALCEATRPPRQLGEPTDQPATCVSCIRYTAEIQSAKSGRR